MKWFVAVLLFSLVIGGLHAQQSPSSPARKNFVDEAGQRISFSLPAGWRFNEGTITNLKGAKLAEFSPGTMPDCSYKNGTAYIQELKAGYPDDVGSPRFVGSRTWALQQTTWTEGIRNVPAWDGKANKGRWYTHDFFAIIDQKCFLMTFFSVQQQLPEEEKVKRFLASLTLK